MTKETTTDINPDNSVANTEVISKGATAKAIFLGLAEADPEYPDDPTKFRYGGAGDPALLRIVHSGKPVSAGLDIMYLAKSAQVSANNIIAILRNPQNRRKDAVERAQECLNQARELNPRFSEYTDERLVAVLENRIRSFRQIDIATNKSNIRSRPKKSLPPPPPPINVVEYYRDAKTLLDGILRPSPPPIGSYNSSSRTSLIRGVSIEAANDTTVPIIHSDVTNAEVEIYSSLQKLEDQS